jgi:hydrogenase maturation protein HypF
MENEETLEHFAATVDLYRKLFRVDPHGVVCDRHPDYLSTRWAHDFASRHGLPLTAVQHHHAHIASCLADNGETGPVIGVAFDGTGLGDDGTVWGGEFLVADLQTSRRVGHLAPVPLPGGEAAIRKPSRMAVACLHAWLPGRFAHPLALPDMDGGEIALVRRQIDRGLNCPLTTSAGRLFDAASALLGIRGTAAYEAHAAIELEAVARRAQSPDREGAGFVSGRPYEFAVDGRFQSPDREGAGFVSGRPYEFAVDGGEVMIVRCAPLLAALLEDVEAGTPVAEAALRFHRTVAEIMRRVCLDVSAQTGLGRVALSGGVFQNRLLVELAVPLLEESGLKVLLHRHVPCNDGGISLGQAAAAASPGRID